ncbi:putative protein kinase RLK-Pelle-DLSV family [Helianthus debilis subsp. tardiflorus]
MVAIKQLSSRSKQVTEEFLAEFATISMLNHENMVKLIGFCAHEPLCLVYEYMTNNSLSHALSGSFRLASLNELCISGSSSGSINKQALFQARARARTR